MLDKMVFADKSSRIGILPATYSFVAAVGTTLVSGWIVTVCGGGY